MANKTIPELPEIEIADLEDSHLTVLETGVETNKLRLDTLIAFIANYMTRPIEVIMDGSTTGDIDVDVSGSFSDATLVQWVLKKPASTPTFGEQMVVPLQTPDAATVRIVQGDFALAAGTYTLIGVGVI